MAVVLERIFDVVKEPKVEHDRTNRCPSSPLARVAVHNDHVLAVLFDPIK